ncbi:hypothetical protein KS4_23550 [Poriferisphaera corsica]|uniref:Uncharacterized protein n=1 Tax=Poriferisphaera corsica TaxID=2528020 RepID=A0A517YVM2_9BACT|nr:hypothetical protein KS4_23550 [Poriferisphaera corsica]
MGEQYTKRGIREMSDESLAETCSVELSGAEIPTGLFGDSETVNDWQTIIKPCRQIVQKHLISYLETEGRLVDDQ